MTHPSTTTDFDDAGVAVEVSALGPDLRVAVHGESDFSKLPSLKAALETIDLDGATAIRLDLRQLAFADVATIRELAAFARAARAGGRDFTTCCTLPTVRKVAILLDAQGDLGLS